MMYCVYYQAYIQPSNTWFFVASLRNFEHLVFDRALDPSTSLFEFFVPEQAEATFLQIMDYFVSLGIVSELKKLPNRLQDSLSAV